MSVFERFDGWLESDETEMVDGENLSKWRIEFHCYIEKKNKHSNILSISVWRCFLFKPLRIFKICCRIFCFVGFSIESIHESVRLLKMVIEEILNSVIEP